MNPTPETTLSDIGNGVKMTADWESLYREEVAAKDGWKQSRQKLLAEIAKLNSNYLQVMTERDQLAQWKREAMTVQDWWHEVDQFVRKHPSCVMGSVVAHEALRMLREWDAMTAPREDWMPKPPQNLREDIIHAINCRNAESGSDTPDWILGNFLIASLAAFDEATNERTTYFRQSDDVTDPPTTTEG
jgi:hypothetical protein